MLRFIAGDTRGNSRLVLRRVVLIQAMADKGSRSFLRFFDSV